MGKRGGGKFGRRTVLQLEEETKKPYGLGYKGSGDKPGVSILGGLIGEYGDSDESHSASDGETDQHAEKGGIAFVPSSEPVMDASLSEPHHPHVNGNSSISKQQPDVQKASDVDAKLQDFLAEIDALGVDTTPNSESVEEWETDTSAEEEQVASHPQPSRPAEPKTSWQHCMDEGTQYYYYWNIASNEVTWEIPDGYSQYLLQYKEYEQKLAKFESDLKEWEKTQKSKAPPKKRKRRKKVKAEAIAVVQPPPPPVGRHPSEIGSSSLGEDETHDAKRRKLEGDSSHSKSKTKHKHRAKDDIESRLAIGPQLPPPPPKPIIGPVLPGNTDGDTMETNEDEEQPTEVVKHEQTTAEAEDEFIYRQLEEPVFDRYTYVNKKYSATQDLGEADGQDTSLGIDIDSELDSALALKQTRRQEEEDEKTSRGGVKRPLPPHVDQLPQPKKYKQELHEDSFIDKNCLKEKVSLLAEAAELSQLVSDKLQFLEVNRSGLSKLQVLLIEMQTRIGDWKCGGLSTDYLIKQLRASDLDLECYEASAAPQGWACRWDRNYKRYYYSHVVSGLCQWEYPEPDYTVNQSQSHSIQLDQSQMTTQNGDEKDSQSESVTDTNATISKEKAEDRTPVDFTSLAGAPPPPPPAHSLSPELPVDSNNPAETSSMVVDYPEEGQCHAIRDIEGQGHVSRDSEGEEVDAEISDTNPEEQSDEQANDAEAAVNQVNATVHCSEEPPPPGTETEPLPAPAQGHKLASLITYDDSDSDSDSRSDNSGSDKNRRSRRSSSSSSSDSSRSSPRRRYSDTSDSEYDPTEPSRDPVPESDDLDGKPLEVENSVANVENSTSNHVNVISKPAHFAAAPVILRPPAIEHVEPTAEQSTPNKNDSVVESTNVSLEEKVKTPAKEATKEKKKRKDKDKSISGGGLAMKKKAVNSLVQKWQKVQKEVEKDTRDSKKPPPPDL